MSYEGLAAAVIAQARSDAMGGRIVAEHACGLHATRRCAKRFLSAQGEYRDVHNHWCELAGISPKAAIEAYWKFRIVDAAKIPRGYLPKRVAAELGATPQSRREEEETYSQVSEVDCVEAEADELPDLDEAAKRRQHLEEDDGA